MNTKQIALLLFLGCSPLAIQCMDAARQTPEQKLFAKKISIDSYLSMVENGLYGNTIGQQLRQIRDAHYINPKDNLYDKIVYTLKFVTGKKGASTPAAIPNLVIQQVQAKTQMLMDYEERGLAQIQSVSGEHQEEGKAQTPFMSGE